MRLHPNTIRSHVEQLIEARLVGETLAPSAGRGRPRVLYEAVTDLVTPNEAATGCWLRSTGVLSARSRNQTRTLSARCTWAC